MKKMQKEIGGGKLFKIAGVVAFVGIFFQRYTLFFIL